MIRTSFPLFFTKIVEKPFDLCYILAMNAEMLIESLNEMHPNAECELDYRSPYELLVAVILSAQCTDKRVNLVTAELFKKYNTPSQIAALPQEALEKEIKSCGFYHDKAKNIIGASRAILDRFGGEVPSSREELMTLPGVGRKTANVVYAVAFKGDAIAVDTHVFRLSHRLGLSKGKDPLEVEKDLCAAFPEKTWSHLHHLLIHHGRYVCRAQSPSCDRCNLTEVCLYFRENNFATCAEKGKGIKTQK